MKRTTEALLLLMVTLLACSGWFVAGYMIADINEELAYDQGLSDGKRQAEELAYDQGLSDGKRQAETAQAAQDAIANEQD